MKYTILVIDDELDVSASADRPIRRALYDKLKDEFELLYAAKPSDLPRLLDSQVVHAVLLDFYLEGWETDARTVLEVIGQTIPVGLISSHWGPTFEPLRAVLATHGRKIAQLFTWEDLENDERRGLVVMWMLMAIRNSRDIAVTSIGPDEPIRILHLSDLQFDTVSPPRFETDTIMLAQRVREVWSGPPTFIAITGDVAQHALPSEYNKALDWLKKLARDLDPNWTDERFLLVPGNHDVCWGLGLSSRVKVSSMSLEPPESSDYSELLPFALAPFRDFAERLVGAKQWAEDKQYWVNGRYRNLGVVYFGYNSCEDLDSFSKPTRKVRDATIAQIFSDIRALDQSDDVLLFGLMHHPLCLSAANEGITNPDDFMKPFTQIKGTFVTICGHVHSDSFTLMLKNSVSVLEVNASTATRGEKDRPADTARGFNMIDLERTMGRICGLRLRVCRFDRAELKVDLTREFKRDERGRLEDRS